MNVQAEPVIARFGARMRTGGDATALAGVWFEAATDFGPVRLYTSGAARHAADAAVVLGRREALLEALEDWLGGALDWHWIAIPEAVTSLASHARVHWRARADRPGRRESVCRLELPWRLVRALPAPAESLAACLRWPSVPALLVAARLLVPEDELALLEPGGAVVIPESLSPEWVGTLRVMDEPNGAGVPVSLAVPAAPRRMAGGAPGQRASAGAGVACEVRLALDCALPGDRLTGWFAGQLGSTGLNASLWRSAAERSAARCLASGVLIPWGDGWALAARNIHDASASRG